MGHGTRKSSSRCEYSCLPQLGELQREFINFGYHFDDGHLCVDPTVRRISNKDVKNSTSPEHVEARAKSTQPEDLAKVVGSTDCLRPTPKTFSSR